jgi:peptide/nickel transport system ATP-binding protein
LLPLLQINNLSLSFRTGGGTQPALKDISLELKPGEMLAVVGESGSGKSVTALSILQLLPPRAASIDSGEIWFSSDGLKAIDLLKLPSDEIQTLRGNRIGMIFQEPMVSLNPVMTCGTQVMEPIRLHRKLGKRASRAEVIQLFNKVRLPEPELLFDKYPHQLSGGQKQRVMIAMAISCKPALLICDEPTTALDVTVQKTILELLAELRKSENMGMLFITHDLGLVADIADRVAVMFRGQIVETGPVKELFSKPMHPYTRGLLLCRPVLHHKGERLPVVSDFLNGEKEEKFTEPAHGPTTINEPVNISRTPQNSVPGPEEEILVRVKNLDVWYSSGKTLFFRKKHWVKAVQDASFDIYTGETLGLVGESGSGKTTLGRALLRLNKPVSGTILYENRDLLAMPDAELRPFRKNIQIVFQDPYSSLNPRLMVGPALSEPLKIHEPLLSRAERKEKVTELFRKVDLDPDFFNRYPHEFSGGQRQRIVIARALALNPGFVVFDESVSALDVSIQAQVLNLINDLKREFGFTAVFISHDLSVIRYLCDRVMVMANGRIVETGDVETVYNHPQTVYTKSLIDAIPGRKVDG